MHQTPSSLPTSTTAHLSPLYQKLCLTLIVCYWVSKGLVLGVLCLPPDHLQLELVILITISWLQYLVKVCNQVSLNATEGIRLKHLEVGWPDLAWEIATGRNFSRYILSAPSLKDSLFLPPTCRWSKNRCLMSRLCLSVASPGAAGSCMSITASIMLFGRSSQIRGQSSGWHHFFIRSDVLLHADFGEGMRIQGSWQEHWRQSNKKLMLGYVPVFVGASLAGLIFLKSWE